MKKYIGIFLALLTIIPLHSAFAESLGYGFDLGFGSNAINVVYKGDIIYTEEYSSITCTDADHPTSITSEEEIEKHCWKQYTKVSSIGKNWYQIRLPGYESSPVVFYNTISKQKFLQEFVPTGSQIKFGASGLYVLSNDYSLRGQRLLLLKKSGEVKELWIAHGDNRDPYLHSFNLLYGGKIRLNIIQNPVYDNKTKKYTGKISSKVLSIY